ncbi:MULTISPECIES: hypothetical protein [Brucella]|uniref:hypothetical protein n=1 Tax=Brucella TaxID=234 RepID=UPI000F8D791A|nr:MULTISPECIES: hypothetical protein [Brucella]MBM0584019.1 hypothetical protein [Brucella melitensis]MBN7675255.1 hypothetical protein [Brucella melitensis]MBN7686984.1 hypothetical protein [Brucella melitensis]MBN7693124.1 hypothetical protein [Brucella melitensis]MBN7699211.1 hypothetical protein [Brucella melitensis]
MKLDAWSFENCLSGGPKGGTQTKNSWKKVVVFQCAKDKILDFNPLSQHHPIRLKKRNFLTITVFGWLFGPQRWSTRVVPRLSFSTSPTRFQACSSLLGERTPMRLAMI